MSGSETSGIDLIRELRLRHWARTNYVPEEIRPDDWHPVVLDEMRRRDEELSEDRDRGPDCSGTPPTPPSMRVRTRRFDAWEQACSRG